MSKSGLLFVSISRRESLLRLFSRKSLLKTSIIELTPFELTVKLKPQAAFPSVILEERVEDEDVCFDVITDDVFDEEDEEVSCDARLE